MPHDRIKDWAVHLLLFLTMALLTGGLLLLGLKLFHQLAAPPTERTPPVGVTANGLGAQTRAPRP